MKLTFRQRLFIYFAVLFTIFTIGIAIFEHSRETTFKTEALEEKLDVYTDIISSTISRDIPFNVYELNKLQKTFPNDLRITLIDTLGNVIYDNTVINYSTLENHSTRPELKLAKENGKGKDIRNSTSTHQPYLYYAKKIDNKYIRVALPYNIQLKQFLKADNLYLYFLLILFLVSIFFIHKITEQFGLSIKKLRDFAINTNESKFTFSDDELGEIGKQISENYLQLVSSKKNLSLEKQKLLQHIQISEEGICFFSAQKQVEFHNGLFVIYLNQLTEETNSNPSTILTETIFEALHQFLNNNKENYFETHIKKNNKTFSLRTTIFDDKSFEIILTDITQQEKTKQLKHEMTGNIAHELRTPITSIRAYLETILEQNLSDDKKLHFTKQAYNQTILLSEILKDMSIIAKLEEAPQTFNLQSVNITQIIEQLNDELKIELSNKQIQMHWHLPANFCINGNFNLLTSIFRNLIENTIRYAGENIEINISMFKETPEHFYILYYDTGVGIENEIHLNRLFERFYRVQEGRTREQGGSGLGLSIVKNAVLFHKGSINVKNRKTGGLEFLIQLHK